MGYFLGGFLVDRLFAPIMASQNTQSILAGYFGTGKGSGAAFFFAVLWLSGMGVCLLFRADPHIWKLDAREVGK